jgi:HEAT repeat protein
MRFSFIVTMNPDNLSRLETNLRAGALHIRKAALDELALLPADEAVPILQRLMDTPDFGLRRLAVMGLGNHRSAAAFQSLKSILEQDKDASVLSEAANSLFDFGEAAIPVLQSLFDRVDHWLVRQTIISLFIDTEYYEVLFSLAEKALEDETQTVKEVGILALSHVWKSPFKVQALVLIAQLSRDSFWRNRWRAAIALQECHDPQAQMIIAALQQDEHFRVVAAALEVASYWQEEGRWA